MFGQKKYHHKKFSKMAIIKDPKSSSDFLHNVEMQLVEVKYHQERGAADSALIKAGYLKQAVEGLISSLVLDIKPGVKLYPVREEESFTAPKDDGEESGYNSNN